MAKSEVYNFNEGLETSNAPTNPATSASGDLVNKTYLDANAPAKQYVSGTAYTNGTPTVSQVSFTLSVVRGVLIPYQTSDGAWRLRFNMAATQSSAARSSMDIQISGITFKNVTNYRPPVTFAFGAGTKFYRCGANFTSNQIWAYFPSTTTTWFSWSGDVELNGKPTWAD